MTLNYTFEPLYKDFPEKQLLELQQQISNSIPFLEKHLDRMIEFLKKEESLENYVEVNLPFFESNISYKLNLFHGKLIISVMLFDDSKIFGHLIIDNYDCLDKTKIKKLGGEFKLLKGEARFKGIY